MTNYPKKTLWYRVNQAIVGENGADVFVTIFSGLSMILVDAGISADEMQARAHMAAMLLSPASGRPGSLLPLLQTEIDRLKGGGFFCNRRRRGRKRPRRT